MYKRTVAANREMPQYNIASVLVVKKGPGQPLFDVTVARHKSQQVGSCLVPVVTT